MIMPGEKFFNDDARARITDRIGFRTITDPNTLKPILQEVLIANPRAVEAIRSGDEKPYGFLVGQVMKKTNGRSEPQLVQKLLREQFSSPAGTRGARLGSVVWPQRGRALQR